MYFIIFNIWNVVFYIVVVYVYMVFDYCKNLYFINSFFKLFWMVELYYNCSSFFEFNVFIKMLKF